MTATTPQQPKFGEDLDKDLGQGVSSPDPAEGSDDLPAEQDGSAKG